MIRQIFIGLPAAVAGDVVRNRGGIVFSALLTVYVNWFAAPHFGLHRTQCAVLIGAFALFTLPPIVKYLTGARRRFAQVRARKENAR